MNTPLCLRCCAMSRIARQRLACLQLASQPASPAPQVAIKMIRSNDVMTKAAQTEQAILRALAIADPDNRKHCIRMLRSFEYRHHTCLVFEPMVRTWQFACHRWTVSPAECSVALLLVASRERHAVLITPAWCSSPWCALGFVAVGSGPRSLLR